MRKLLWLLAIVAALAIPTAALAASLDTGKFGDYISGGAKCANGAYYHLVNVQSGGVDGTVTVDFSGAGDGTFNSYQSPGNTTHFLVWGTGTLNSATNNLPGFIVISDYFCKK